MIRKVFFLLIIYNLSIILIYSQDIKKDITIVKPYQPTIQDFYKINLMPSFSDTSYMSPQFNYLIKSVKIDVPYQPKNIPIAKIAPESTTSLLNNYLKLGIGNPNSPYAEVSFTNGRDKKYAYGLYLKHHSASGSVKLDDNATKIDAPYSNNEIIAFGKYITKTNIVNSSLSYSSNKYRFYGIDPSYLNIYNKDSSIQHIQEGKIKMNLESSNNDSNKLYYNSNLKYAYFVDYKNNIQNNFYLAGTASINYKEFYVGVDISNDYYSYNGKNNDTSFNNIFTLRPFLSKSKNSWRLKTGLNISLDKDYEGTSLVPFPFVSFDFIIVPQVLKAEVSYDGFVEPNNYYSLIKKNPYVKPDIFTPSSTCNSMIKAGISGSISSEIQFSILATYSNIKDQIFFINDTNTTLKNTFITTTDDVEYMKYSCYFSYDIMKKTNLSLSFLYNNYSMTHERKPWGVPIYEVKARLVSNLHDKIILKTDLFFIGHRYAYLSKDKFLTLNPIFDLNERIEYAYTKYFLLYTELKNITSSRYQYWNQYSSYRFQITFGFVYLF